MPGNLIGMSRIRLPSTQAPTWDDRWLPAPAPCQIPGLEHMPHSLHRKSDLEHVPHFPHVACGNVACGHVAQNRVLHANEVSRGPECLANELPFLDILSCKSYLISGPHWGGSMHQFSKINTRLNSLEPKAVFFIQNCYGENGESLGLQSCAI